jgi:hypothetical protein
LLKYNGPEFVARDSTAVFLDWDDTLFPSTWVQIQQRSCREAGRPCVLRADPATKVLCREIIAFLCAVSRIGHVFIVTASTPGFITKCCRICFPELQPVFDELNVNIIYARPQFYDIDEEPVDMWKENAYRTILQGSFMRPLVPALARFYDSRSGWSRVLSYGDSWSDHTALRSALATASPLTVHVALKCCPARFALSAEALAKELPMAGRLLRRLASVEVDCSYDFEDAQFRARVEQLTGSEDYASTIALLNGFSPVIPVSDRKSTISSTSTVSSVSATVEGNSSSTSQLNSPEPYPSIAERCPSEADFEIMVRV